MLERTILSESVCDDVDNWNEKYLHSINHNLDDADADHEKLAQSIAKRRVNTEEHLRYGRTLSTRMVRRY